MEGLPKGVWAKLHREQREVVAWQPLHAHCADVAAVTERLLKQSIIGHRLARLANQEMLSSVQIARLCALAALHDAGKVNNGFQQRASDTKAPLIGHVSPLINFLKCRGKEKELIVQALDLQSIFSWFGTEANLVAYLLATLAHHGKPVRPLPQFKPDLWQANPVRDPIAELSALRKATEQWFPEAFNGSESDLPDCPELQHAFNGLVTLADWIASDESFFPFADGLYNRMPESRRLASNALVKLGLDANEARISLGHGRLDFHTIAPSHFRPRPAQVACAQLPLPDNGSLVILESDTGSGKTEAALTRFIQLFQAGLVDGMYFALPTRTAATQLHNRVVEATERAFPDPSTRPAVVLAVPGYLQVDSQAGQRLAPFNVLWDDDESERWRFRGWAAERPKRYLAGTIAVGTIDQVLLSTLQVKHAHLRATSLLRHLLVVDEVHASDVYMGRLTEKVLDYHMRAGGHALLMSATLGTVAQARLIGRQSRSVPTFGEAKDLHYPLITHTDGRRQRVSIVNVKPSGYSKSVHVEEDPIADNPRLVAQKALDAALSGARILVIRNTVRDCVGTQIALEKLAVGKASCLFQVNGVPAPHHSRFATNDRKAMDESIEKAFGKSAENKGVVAVATQTVQQSLDLDADYMLTDLCPADVLLQRIGRLHRHPKHRPASARPAGYCEAYVTVLVPRKRDLGQYISSSGFAFGPHGLGTVYEDLRILEATWRLVEDKTIWAIPSMNRELVETATHPESLDNIVEELGGTWHEHSQQILGIRGADRTHAQLLLLPRDTRYGEELFPTDLNERIRTRLGEDNRRIQLPDVVSSPFGAVLRELVIPARWLPEDAEASEAKDVHAKDGVLSFSFAGKPFTYDRLGLRPTDFTRKEESIYE